MRLRAICTELQLSEEEEIAVRHLQHMKESQVKRGSVTVQKDSVCGIEDESIRSCRGKAAGKYTD